MTKPLALVYYEKLLPGTQLTNRLTDLGYRVQGISELSSLVDAAQKEKPLILFIDLESGGDNCLGVIQQIKSSEETGHLPIIATVSPSNSTLEERARSAGAEIVIHDTVVLRHLEHFMDQALQI